MINRKGRPKRVLKPLLSLGEFAAVLGSCSGDVGQRADRHFAVSVRATSVCCSERSLEAARSVGLGLVWCEWSETNCLSSVKDVTPTDEPPPGHPAPLPSFSVQEFLRFLQEIRQKQSKIGSNCDIFQDTAHRVRLDSTIPVICVLSVYDTSNTVKSKQETELKESRDRTVAIFSNIEKNHVTLKKSADSARPIKTSQKNHVTDTDHVIYFKFYF